MEHQQNDTIVISRAAEAEMVLKMQECDCHIAQCSSTFSFYHDTPSFITMVRDDTPQNIALRKGGTKQYVATTMWILYANV
jgi:hypothetical protein